MAILLTIDVSSVFTYDTTIFSGVVVVIEKPTESIKYEADVAVYMSIELLVLTDS